MVKPRAMRSVRPQVETLTLSQERELLHGRGYFAPERLSDENFAAAWAFHRERLRSEWAAENPPGTRCFAEWLLVLVPRFGERRLTEWWTAEHEGYRENWETRGILHLHTWPPSQEPEHEYLFRNGVIDEAEYHAAVELHNAAHAGDEEIFEQIRKPRARGIT